jgi:hypothetical protein
MVESKCLMADGEILMENNKPIRHLSDGTQKFFIYTDLAMNHRNFVTISTVSLFEDRHFEFYFTRTVGF